MISHLSFGVSDLSSATRFYDAALLPLGLIRLWTAADGAGYGRVGGDDVFAVKAQPQPQSLPPRQVPRRVRGRQPRRRRRLPLGCRDAWRTSAGEPGIRATYSPTYYAAFACDPDGFKIEAVHQ